MSGYSAKVIKLQKENKQLRKAFEIKHYCKYANRCNELYDCTREEYNSMAECNMKLLLENDELQQRIDKAIELAKIRIESCNAGLSNDETSIVSKHSLLRLEIQSYKELLEILGDKENE